MKLSIATLFSATVATVASPTEKRAVGGVLMCTGVRSSGTCEHRVYALEECHQLPKPYYRNVNTFAPDDGDFFCYPRLTNCDDVCRSPAGCSLGMVDADYEHKYNLSAVEWNKVFSSFNCHRKRGSS